MLIIHVRGWRQQRLVCESRIVHRMPAPTRGAPTPPATTRQGSGRHYHVYSTISSDAIYTAYNYVPVIFTDSNIRLSQRIASIRNAPAKDASADTRALPPPATTQQRRRWRTLLYIYIYIILHQVMLTICQYTRLPHAALGNGYPGLTSGGSCG